MPKNGKLRSEDHETPVPPAKAKVKKNRYLSKIRKRSDSDNAGKIKDEVGEAVSSQNTPVEGTLGARIQPAREESPKAVWKVVRAPRKSL